MNNNIESSLSQWINGAGPFSYNPCDMYRFYAVIEECIKENYILTQEDIIASMKKHLKITNEIYLNEKSEEFEIRANSIYNFVRYLKDKKGIDIQTEL